MENLHCQVKKPEEETTHHWAMEQVKEKEQMMGVEMELVIMEKQHGQKKEERQPDQNEEQRDY